jgi:hypothetical protein
MCYIGNVEKRVHESVLEQNVDKRVREIGIEEEAEEASIHGNDASIHDDS